MELNKLNKILEYQKVDMEFYRLEKEYGQSKELERLYRCRKMFDEKKNALVQLNRDLDEVFAQISALDVKVDNFNSNSDETKFNLMDVKEASELAILEKEFSKYEEDITAFGKEINRLMKKINDVNFDNKRINEEMQSINNEFKKLNAVLEDKKKVMLIKAKPIVVKLKTMMSGMDEDYIKKYTELRKAKKMPAFVPYNEGSCGGCGMDISIEVKSKMVNKGDIAECPHCGRVVYKRN